MQRRIFHFGGGLLVAVALVSGAQAEPSVAPISAGRAQAQIRTPSVAAGVESEAHALPVYRSPLDAYRPYRVDEPLRAWKDANDEVGRLRGHMGHLTPSPKGGGR